MRVKVSRLVVLALVAFVIGVPLAGGAELDIAAPSIASSTPASPANDTNPILNGTAEALSTVNVYKDSCPSAVVFTGTADTLGAFHVQVAVDDNTTTTFYATATDLLGNPSPCSEGFTYVEDSVNPLVTLTEKPPALTNQTVASFSFVSSKLNSTFECKLDGAGFKACTDTSPVLYTGLDDGQHTFAVRATNVSTGPPTEYTWTVDTVAPSSSITSTPLAVSNSASANFAFASSEVGSTFFCSLDASGFAPCGSPTSYSGLGDGAHTFRVEAVDPAGNADPTPATYSWQIAGVGPATIDRTPPGNVKRLKRTVGYGSLKLSWSRPPDSDFDHVEVFVSTSAKSLPRTPVYKGKASRYTNMRFRNGLYYRYAVVSYDHTGNASRGSAAVVPPSILLRSPRAGRRVHAPPLLVWAGVRKATFYNVQLYFRGRKVLSAWPNSAKLKLSRSWRYEGRRFRLRKGSYQWYVWPGFGPRSKARYGQLLGQSGFKVG
jgi:Big-like domain-containing protein